MIQNLKYKLLVISSVLMFGATAMVPVAVNAAPAPAPSNADPQNAVCQGANNLSIPPDGAVDGSNCSTTTSGGTSRVNDLIRQIINIFSVIVGVVAVIMIIVGGFRYITSGGDSGKVGSAKNTILYALIGLIIVALAQIIVKFVLSKAVGTGASS